MAGGECSQQRFAGKEKRGANLAGFEDVADTVFKPRVVPDTLILEALGKENIFQFFQRLVTEIVLSRLLTFPFVPVGNVRV